MRATLAQPVEKVPLVPVSGHGPLWGPSAGWEFFNTLRHYDTFMINTTNLVDTCQHEASIQYFSGASGAGSECKCLIRGMYTGIATALDRRHGLHVGGLTYRVDIDPASVAGDAMLIHHMHRVTCRHMYYLVSPYSLVQSFVR